MDGAYPIIIIGSPRSGTTLVARLLQSLGLFVGLDLKPRSCEPLTFLRLNDWIYRESGATFFRPAPVREALVNAYASDLFEAFLRDRVFSSEAEAFTGKQHYRQYGSLARFAIPWGWKDPRTTFTLPIWLKLFPSAVVVHVYRHAVDVATSQVAFYGTRLEQMIRNYEASWRRGARLARQLRKRLRLPKKVRSEGRVCSSYLEGAFATWQSYIVEGRRQVQTLGERGLEVKYEKLLSNPRGVLQTLAEYCGLSTSAERIGEATQQVRCGRAYAFQNDPSLRVFAERVAARLEPYGYSPADRVGGSARAERSTPACA
jgi:hypothetical protein